MVSNVNAAYEEYYTFYYETRKLYLSWYSDGLQGSIPGRAERFLSYLQHPNHL
jgi:hypothetical protein